MEIYEALKNLYQKDKDNLSAEYKIAAKEYSENGYDEATIRELLQADGCPFDIANQLSAQEIGSLPEDYNHVNPPKSYNDVFSSVDSTIKTGSIEKISRYFEIIGKPDITNRIMLARDNGVQLFFEEIHKEIEPIVEDSIITNGVLAGEREFSAEIDEKEELEKDLFGVWPIYLMQKHERKDKATEAFLEKIKPKYF